jgi:hypothetical protein
VRLKVMASQVRVTRSIARLVSRRGSGRVIAGPRGSSSVTWECADEAVTLKDLALAHADLTGIGQKDFRPGKVDGDSHATNALAVAAMPTRLTRYSAVSDECTQRYATPILAGAVPVPHRLARSARRGTHAAADGPSIRSGRIGVTARFAQDRTLSHAGAVRYDDV